VRSSLLTTGSSACKGRLYHCGWEAHLPDKRREGRDSGSDSSGKTLAEIVLQTINSIVLVANGKGEVLYASPSVKTILGYEPEELLGMKYWDTPSTDPELRKKHFEKIAAVARGEERVADAPYAVKMLTREGEEKWILWRDATANGNLVVGSGARRYRVA
jgi:PAS domain S-box-containing protein